jgi:hypothetical protein
MRERGNIFISVLLGVLAASIIGLTTDQILQNVYDSTNTALRINVVIRGASPAAGSFTDLTYSGKLNITGIVAVSSNGTVGSSTRIESCTSGSSADVTRTLPAATGSGRVIDLVKSDSGTKSCIFGRTGSDTLNGATTRTLSSQYKADTCIDIASVLWLCRGDGT